MEKKHPIKRLTPVFAPEVKYEVPVKQSGMPYSKEEVREAIRLANSILDMLNSASEECDQILKRMRERE